MVKRFTVWMEDQAQKQRLIHTLLFNFGRDRNALDKGDIIISDDDRQLKSLIDVINALPIGEDNKEKMVTFAQTNHKSLSLKALTDLINPDDIEVQDKASSNRAVLPQATQPVPKPMPDQQRQQMMQQQNPPPLG